MNATLLRKRTLGIKPGVAIANAFVLLFAFYTLLPLLYVVFSSTKGERELFTTFGLWFGTEINIVDNIRNVFTYRNGVFVNWLLNSAWYSASSAFLATFFSAAAGYAFAKFRFAGSNVIFGIILAAVMVPQTALVIPIFLMATKLGIIDTAWVVILPSCVFPLGVFLMRFYADRSIPSELLEAARMDGAGEFRIFFTIALRLMAPGFVTVLLLAFVSTWNNYFLPLVLLNTPEKLPVTVGLANWYAVAASGQTPDPMYTMTLTGALISIIPLILAFIFLQRFLQDGITAGAVKA